MARKTLLTESEVRRFLKLANLGAVGHQRLEEMGALHQKQEDESLEEDLGELEDEDPMAAGGDLDIPGEEEMPPEGLEGEEEEIEPIDDTGEGSVETLVQALVDTIADVTGVPISMDTDVEGGEEFEAELGEEPGLEGGLEGDPEGELGGAGLPGEEPPPPGDRGYQMQEDQLVAEVARRVATRLAKQTQKEQLADTLAERILTRLTK